MLNRKDLQLLASAKSWTMSQLEKDYLQHLLLYLIGQDSLSERLVFKGGTCLQKTFGLDRYSEDLDFTLEGDPDAVSRLPEVVSRLSDRFGFQAQVRRESAVGARNSYAFRIKINGPLYTGAPHSVCAVYVDVSVRESVVRPVEVKSILPAYAEVPPYVARVMALEEIFSEKVRAVLERDKARDLYDLAFLVRKGVKPDFDLIGSKLALHGLVFDVGRFQSAVRRKRDYWTSDLKGLLASVPSFEESERVVLAALSN